MVAGALQPRPDKDWNVKLANERYDHGRMSHCKFETFEENGEIKLRTKPKRRVGTHGGFLRSAK